MTQRCRNHLLRTALLHQNLTRARVVAGNRRFSRSCAFTLMEVMIACGIFFMATFAILALVSTTLRNARAIQRSDIDAGMAAAMVYRTLKTNRNTDLSGHGDFSGAL